MTKEEQQDQTTDDYFALLSEMIYDNIDKSEVISRVSADLGFVTKQVDHLCTVMY
jgi:hypothetical protein